MRSVVVLSILILGAWAQAEVESPTMVFGHPEVISKNFHGGVYTQSIETNPPNNKTAAQDCSDDAANLLAEGRKNEVEISRFECRVDSKGGYRLKLYSTKNI